MDAPEIEEITIVTRSSVRVYVPSINEYRDIGYAGASKAALVIDSRDPAFEFMKQLALTTPGWEVVGVKKAVLACEICGLAVPSQDALAIHAIEVHVDNGEEEESGQPRLQASPRSVAEREARQRRTRATREG